MSLRSIQLLIPSPLQPWDIGLFRHQHVSVWIKRDDLIHPLAGGNKIRKLQFQLTPDALHGKSKVVTFGGPASNHVVAAAWYCSQLGADLTAYVRGEVVDNPCSRYLRQMGVKMISMGRSEFAAIQRSDFPDALVIPFGGTHPLALPGVGEVVREIREELPDGPVHLCVPAGSGGTAAGLALALNREDTLRVYPAIKGSDLAGWLKGRLSDLGVEPSAALWVDEGAAGQGFARRNDQLWTDLCVLAHETGLWWDPVYNGKMILRLLREIREGLVPPGSRVVVLHTGGLPGGLAYRDRFHLPPMPNMPGSLA